MAQFKNMRSKAKTIYRPDIDGLRAIAVLSVIVYHFNENILPSGFLGVDIFFVISGFVVTSALANNAGSSWKNYLASFYLRRIKRLLPALIVCVLVTSMFGWMFITPTSTELATSLKTGVAALFAVSNIDLLKESTDYFGHSSELNLFTHTWSLGIEEQFYLIFPIILGLVGFSRKCSMTGYRNLLLVILLFGSASLSAYLYFSTTRPLAVFYLMPTRFWELSAGCLVYLATQKFSADNVGAPKVISWLSIVVIALMIAALLMPNDMRIVLTVYIVVITCVAIWLNQANTIAMYVLSWPWVVQVGLLSYSLYLWHWSVLVVSRYTIGVTQETMPMQIGLILLLAVASYYVIEKPFRYAEWSRVKLRTIACVSLALIMSVLLLSPIKNEFGPSLYLDKYVQVDNIASALDVEKCFKRFAENPEVNSSHLSDCTVSTQESDHKLILAGDSHANAMVNLGAKFSHKIGYEFTSLSYGGCIFPPSPVKYGHLMKDILVEKTSCQTFGENYKNAFMPYISERDIILIESHWTYYFKRAEHNKTLKHFIGAVEISWEEALKYYLVEIEKLADEVLPLGVSIILVSPLPQFSSGGEVCRVPWFRSTSLTEESCQTDKSMEYSRDIKEAIIKTAASKQNIYLWDAVLDLCPSEDKCFSFSSDIGQPLFRDTNHLSNYGAEYLYDGFVSFLKENSLI